MRWFLNGLGWTLVALVRTILIWVTWKWLALVPYPDWMSFGRLLFFVLMVNVAVVDDSGKGLGDYWLDSDDDDEQPLHPPAADLRDDAYPKAY